MQEPVAQAGEMQSAPSDLSRRNPRAQSDSESLHPPFDLPADSFYAGADESSPAHDVENAPALTDDDAIPEAAYYTPLEDRALEVRALEIRGEVPPKISVEASLIHELHSKTPRAVALQTAGEPLRRPARRRKVLAIAVVILLAAVATALVKNGWISIPSVPSERLAADRTVSPPPAAERSSPQDTGAAAVPANPPAIAPIPSSADPVAGQTSPLVNPFDLSNCRIAFLPDAGGGYSIEPMKFAFLQYSGAALQPSIAARQTPVRGWRIDIPFEFAFGGITWDTAFVNLNGSITFGYAEADAWPEREPQSEVDAQAAASVLNSRAAAGRERMLAPFWWGFHPDSTKVFVNTAAAHVAITWTIDETTGSRPSRVSAIQAVLRDTGTIEYAYQNASMQNGVVGVFPGITWAGEPLAGSDDPEDAADPNVEIVAFQAENAPSVIQFTLTLRAVIPVTVASGELIHRITLDTAEGPRQFGVTVTNEPRGWLDWGPEPRTLGYERDVNKLYFYLSKDLIPEMTEANAHAEVVWKGYDGLADRVDPLTIPLSAASTHTGQVDFSAPGGPHLGSVYEVFH